MSDDLTQRKRTMIKTRVGCVRTSTYPLPNGDHVYGYKQPADSEGAGACEFILHQIFQLETLTHQDLTFEVANDRLYHVVVMCL